MIRTVAALVVLAALLAVTLGSLVLIVRATRETANALRKVHLQQATIIGMLLRAGFRPARRGQRDWFDDADKTQDAYGEWFTRWGTRPMDDQ